MSPAKQAPVITRPRFVALDSSHLGKLARDYFSGDARRQERAQSFQAEMAAIACVPFLCWHHVAELLRHRDPRVASDRLQYLNSMPLLGWISAFSGEDMPDSVIDIQCYEITAALRSQKPDADAVRVEASKHVIRFGTGEQAMLPFMGTWRLLQPELWKQESREREVVAISRSNASDVSRTKFADWLTGELRSPEDAAKRLQHLAQLLGQDIKARDDKRIPSPTGTAQRFFEQVTASSAKALSEPGSSAMQILNAVGVYAEDITDGLTMGDVSGLAAFRQKLRVINRTLQLPWDDVRKVSEKNLPSFVIEASLREYGHDQPERKGSELADGYLAVLSAYVDVTFVDKRMHENFKRARQHSSAFSDLIRQVEKAADYWEIPRLLTE